MPRPLTAAAPGPERVRKWWEAEVEGSWSWARSPLMEAPGTPGAVAPDLKRAILGRGGREMGPSWKRAPRWEGVGESPVRA